MRTEFAAPAGSRAAFRLPTLSRLPPLTALRAFVVAARHASFSRAAEELHVSTAAIGQQVRILETHLGQPLFSRQRGELLLTDAGNALYPGLADAFETMIGSLSDLMVSNARPQLKVLAEGCFAARWLAPRLGSIVPALGDVELSIESLESETIDLTHFDADCAIVATHAQIPGFIHEPLFADTVSAVCTRISRPAMRLQTNRSGCEISVLRCCVAMAWTPPSNGQTGFAPAAFRSGFLPPAPAFHARPR